MRQSRMWPFITSAALIGVGVVALVVACALTGCGSSLDLRGPESHLRATDTFIKTDPITGQPVTHIREREGTATGPMAKANGDTTAAKNAGTTPALKFDGMSSTEGDTDQQASAARQAFRHWFLLISAIGITCLAAWKLYAKQLACAINNGVSAAILWACFIWPEIGDIAIVGAVLYCTFHSHVSGDLLAKSKSAFAHLVKGIDTAPDSVKEGLKSHLNTTKALSPTDQVVVATAKAKVGP